MYQTKIAGVGHYVPERIVTSEELENKIGLPKGWIVRHTGVRERRFAGEGQIPSEFACFAAEKAIKSAGISPKDIDMIISATTCRDMAIPATAAIIQDKIGAHFSAVFDLNAVCLSFLLGFDLAHQYISNGTYKNILVVSAELPSRVLNWEDKNTVGLFGDAAGAIVLTRAHNNEPSGIVFRYFACDGRKKGDITVKGFGLQYHPNSTKTTPQVNTFSMNGLGSFESAVKIAEDFFGRFYKINGFDPENVDLVIPHQANLPGLKRFMKKANMPFSKCYINIDRYGNTSSASIPLALSEAIMDGRVKRGNRLIMAATGAGFSWGGCCLIY